MPVSSAQTDCVPAICTHRPSLLPMRAGQSHQETARPPCAAIEIGQCRALRGSKSRNKVVVGEPAAGSLKHKLPKKARDPVCEVKPRATRFLVCDTAAPKWQQQQKRGCPPHPSLSSALNRANATPLAQWQPLTRVPRLAPLGFQSIGVPATAVSVLMEGSRIPGRAPKEQTSPPVWTPSQPTCLRKVAWWDGHWLCPSVRVVASPSGLAQPAPLVARHSS